MVEIYEQDLSSLLNSFNEGICYLNAQGELLHYNEIAQKHWERDDSLSNKLILQSPIARALAGEHVLHELVHLDEQRILLINTVPLHDSTKTITGVVVISLDVSEHVSLEQQAELALNVLLAAILDTHGIEDIDEALRRIAALIPQLESAHNGIAFRVDDTTGRLIPIALFGSSEESYEEWRNELTTLQLSAEHLLQSSSPAYLQTLRLARPLMYDFTSTSSSMFSNPRNLSAAIYAPVFLNGQVIGILGAERHRPLGNTGTYFPHWSIQLLAALARLASMSIEQNSLLSSLERLQREAEGAHTLLKQKEEFLLLTAHELKNPLTAIRGQAQVLRRRIERSVHVDTETTQETHDLIKSLNSIEGQTRRIETMINTLLEVSRIDLDRLQLEPQDIDLVQFTKRILKEHLPLATHHELHLIVNDEPVSFLEDTTATSPIIIQADEQYLEQVLSNLLSNALKYSPEGGPITVSLTVTDDSQIELAIEDRGIGIPFKDQARLTERFYRGENAQQSNFRGLGLGLYLVKALVARHRGSLSVQSEGLPGKGSRFAIILPYQKQ